ncbi:pilus assembly protein [Streptomyces sp. NPDC057280]|uniref:pilus assembly protein n=1 Tax=Streptomyces sp. NPDC057280 TaxID=3346081 RepID=UPI003644AEFF
MTPLIIATLVLVWQFVLVGYTFTLAGHAADEAVRAGTASEGQADCEEAGLKDLPGAWQGDAQVKCWGDGDYVRVNVRLKVPVLFPGAIGFPFTVEGHAGAVQEEKD